MSSSRYIKSSTDVEKLNENIFDMTKEMIQTRKAQKKNTDALAKINAEVERNRVDKIEELEAAIKKLETETQWVTYDQDKEVGLDPDHIYKKLNIL